MTSNSVLAISTIVLAVVAFVWYPRRAIRPEDYKGMVTKIILGRVREVGIHAIYSENLVSRAEAFAYEGKSYAYGIEYRARIGKRKLIFFQRLPLSLEREGKKPEVRRRLDELALILAARDAKKELARKVGTSISIELFDKNGKILDEQLRFIQREAEALGLVA